MFNFLRRKAKEEKKALHSINSGAWSRILEPYAGAWQQNIEIHLDSVLAYPAIFSCISLISADIAKMPMTVKRRQSNGVWVRGNNPQLSPLLLKPNFYQTSMQFFELWMISKLAHGNAYILKLRDAGDRVQQLRVLDPRRVIPYISDDGEIFYSILTDELNGLPGSLYVPARELIHDRFNTFFHPLCGLSPVYASGLAAIGGEAMLRNSAHTFKNGGKPGGIITVPGSVDQDKAKEIKDNWNSGYTGENAGKTALLADGATFNVISQTATDSQLVEQLNLSNQLVASTFRVPLYKIDTGQTPSYNNIEALEQAYYSQCLQVHMTAIEGLIADTFDLDEQTCVEFDHSRLLRMDTAARYKSYGDGIGSGFLAPNEARIKENMQPVEGGDTPYLQQQNYSLAALAKRDAQDNPFSTGATSTDTTTQTDDDPNPTPGNDPNQPPSSDDARAFTELITTQPNLFTEAPMITERERGFAEIIRQSIDNRLKVATEELKGEFDNLLSENENIIDIQEEVINKQMEEGKKFSDSLDKIEKLLVPLLERVTELEKSGIDESAIAANVYAQIEQPEIPDVGLMVKEALSQIVLPQPEPLPDIKRMVFEQVSESVKVLPTADDLSEMVRKAVGDIDLPEPEPVIPPDINEIIDEVVARLILPTPEPLPDIDGMVKKAFSEISIPEPEPLPDIKQMIADAVSQIVIPEPEPLPDVTELVKKAVSEITLPEPEPLPDIKKMIFEAVNAIDIPQPEPLPDIEAMVKDMVSKIEIPKPQPMPDFREIIKSAIANIKFPKPEPLPDIGQLIREAIGRIEIPIPDVKQLVEEAIKNLELPEPQPLPDIQALVRSEVAQIELPKPEPVAIPDFHKMIQDAVSEIQLPEPKDPEPLPDIQQMVKEAVESIEIPQPKEPEPLPDIAMLLERAVSEYPMPEPEPLPDIGEMVRKAIDAIKIPQPKEPEPLPDIKALISEAVSQIRLPEPEKIPLPDFDELVSQAVEKAMSGIHIPEPSNGQDGKDGLQIEVIPQIDVNKSYPRGTYAIHNGGLWRAYQNTAGLSGFECVLNGLKDIDVTVSDDRHFKVTLSKSNGETEERGFDIPVMIYRDVYHPGTKYYPGDCVTFGGSIWHCFEETSDRPNDIGSSGWRLAVKRGRDGRSRE